MKLVDFSIRRPVSIFIFSVAAIVFGAVAFRQLATDLLPDISYPSLTVQTRLEGAAPLEIESLLTRPVENAVGVVNNVVRVVSSSRAEISEVTLELSWKTNMDLAALDVRERLDMLRLPPEAERPVLLRYDPSLDPILRVGLTGLDDLVHLRRVAEEEVQRALERLDGVAAVVVSGGLEEEIVVEIDENQLANLGISIDRVRSQLEQENVNLTGGRLREGQSEYLVRTVNEVVRPEELEDIVIASSGGAVVELRDVARVVSSHRDREIVTRIDGRESVEVAVYKEGGTNTVTVSDTVQASLGTLRERLHSLDPRLELTLVTDQARYIRQSVREVLATALWGGLLAIAVLYLFLRSWKTTSIIGVAIPISVVATFFLMYLSGISLNVMSLGGLTLGIGLLVDNSIVVLEAIQRRRDAGLPAAEAARLGATEVGRAVVASTLTTICVFVPIVFVEGVAGQLFGDQALTVTYSLAVSLLVALTLLPSLAARSSEDREDALEAGAGVARGRLLVAAVAVARVGKAALGLVQRLVAAVAEPAAKAFQGGVERLTVAYRRLLSAALGAPLVTLGIAAAALLLSFAVLRGIGRELVPELIQGELFVNLELPPGTNLEVTRRRLATLEEAARQIQGVATVYSIAGSSNDQGGVAGQRRENIGQLTVIVEPPTSAAREAVIIERLRGDLDRQEDLDFRFGRPAYFSFKTPIEVEIRGFNLAILERLADALTERMAEIPGLSDVKSSTEGGTPELQVRFDRRQLARLGLSIADVAPTLRAKVQGTVASDIAREDRVIDIRVRAAEPFRDSVDDVRRLIVSQAGKTAIPLSAVATVEEREGPAEIRRTEGDRVAVVTANLAGSDLGTASAAIAAALGELELPSGFDARIGGQRQEMETSFDSMRLAIGLAIFMVYLVMASQFESLLHPFVILFSVPFAVVGVIAILAATSTPVSIVVLIGAILLAGIVVNNAILLVDAANRLRAEGRVKLEALLEAGTIRLRPILMTTATTVLGLLPMAIGFGEGSELRRPMALTVIGGLLTSTLLTLLVTPTLYRLLDRSR